MAVQWVMLLCLLLTACSRSLTVEPPLGAVQGLADQGSVPSSLDGLGSLQVRVIDGDTLELNGRVHRLFGIDSPELSQNCRREDQSVWPCGRQAAEFLQNLVQARVIECREVEGSRDRYDRLISRCQADALDVNRQMVANGYAWAYVRYSAEYADSEQQARKRGLGVWQGEAEPPWHVRRSSRSAESDTPDAPSHCRIKGNISAGGKIFHEPGSADYERTRINTARGERWFCSIEQALAAGWRARR